MLYFNEVSLKLDAITSRGQLSITPGAANERWEDLTMSMWDMYFRFGNPNGPWEYEIWYIYIYTGQYIDDFRDVKFNIFGWLYCYEKLSIARENHC